MRFTNTHICNLWSVLSRAITNQVVMSNNKGYLVMMTLWTIPSMEECSHASKMGPLT